jgi:hypothetical protein
MRRHVCDERWHNITRSIRLRGAMALAAQEALRQPTWCTLPPDKFAPLVERASRAFPENILFVYKVRGKLLLLLDSNAVTWQVSRICCTF